MSSAFPLQVGSGNGVRFRKIKGKFSFSEVHILLDEVKKNRHVVVGKFNSSVPTELKKRKWAEITQSINEIGESDREVNEVIKKWAELECDTKHKMAALHSGAPYPPELSQAETIVSSILDLDLVAPPPPPPGSRKRRRSEDRDEAEGEAFGTRPGPRLMSEMKTTPPPPAAAAASPSVKCDVAADSEAAPIDSDDSAAASPAAAASPVPEEASASPCAREQLAQSAGLSVQEQHMTNALLGSVSRSLELLAESVQQLAETQQEFSRQSLLLQRETVHVLRDFASGALALLHDRLNGKPPPPLL